jgi:hypothetical protein
LKTAHALALAAVFAAESALFCVVTSRHHAWIYPRWNDQLEYLGQAYDGYEHMRLHGFARAAWHTLTLGAPQGSLHAFLALLVFMVAGPSRSAALAVNLLAFLALQAATFGAARRISGSASIAWASVALLAAVAFPWSGGAASAVDFRLDWMASCAYGVALAAAIESDGFRSTRWAALFGAAAGVVILIRHLTAVYLALILLFLMVWLLSRPDGRARCGRLLLAAAVAAGLSGPALWASRFAIHSYYWFGQIAGPESAVRASRTGLVESIKWLFTQLLFYQVGLGAALLGLGAACALLAARSGGNSRREPGSAFGLSLCDAWAATLAFLGAPAAVLSFHPIKAPQALCILIPSTVWIVILTWTHLARGMARVCVAAICGMTTLIGALLFVGAETRQSASVEKTADFRRINALSDYLFFRAEESELARPRVAVTWFVDGLNASALQVLGYERHGRMLPFVLVMPTSLFGLTRDVAMGNLADSDFVCLVTRAAPVFPFDLRMMDLLPETRRWCEGHLRHVGDLDNAGLSVSVYERPALGRQATGSAVDFGAFMRAASVGPANADPVPPAPPRFVGPLSALASTQAEFRYALAAAYSPVRYGAADLPEGLSFDPRAGEIRGRFPRPGSFAGTVTASNAAGSTRATLAVHVEDLATYAVLEAPGSCSVGSPVELSYGAFDAGGKLDFVEITDLTARRTLARIAAPEDSRQSWRGSYTAVFSSPGKHAIVLRTVCFDAARKDAYSFVDRTCEISVAP